MGELCRDRAIVLVELLTFRITENASRAMLDDARLTQACGEALEALNKYAKYCQTEFSDGPALEQTDGRRLQQAKSELDRLLALIRRLQPATASGWRSKCQVLRSVLDWFGEDDDRAIGLAYDLALALGEQLVSTADRQPPESPVPRGSDDIEPEASPAFAQYVSRMGKVINSFARSGRRSRS
jgi:hypothetical protein